MAKLLTMARFRCFPIFNKKNKHEIPRYVDRPQSLPMEFLAVDVSGKDSPDARKNTDREMLSNNAAHGDHKAVFIVGEKQLDSEDTNEIKSQPGSVLDHNQLNGCVEDDNFSFAPQLGKSGDDSPGMAYDGGDEEEAQPFNNRRVASSLDWPMFSKVEYAIPSGKMFPSRPMDSCDNVSEIKPELDCKYDEGMQEGHLSDPGFSKSEYLSPESVSPVFRRSKSVSKLEISRTRRLKKAEGKEVAYSTPLPPSNSQSYEDLQTLEGAQRGIRASQGSHCSEMTSCSADKVMLKRGSSSKVLPSRARKLWWKIFLWSHRNLHKGSGVNENGHSHTFEAIQKQYNAAGGYSSDTLDMCREKLQKRQEDCGKSTPVGSVYDLRAGENVQTATGTRNIKQIDTVHTCRDPTSQSSNQWMAFSVDQSPMQRVQEWINSIDNSITAENGRELQEDTDAKTQAADAETYETIVPEAYNKAATSFQESNMPEELQLANNAIRSLNAFSTVAHISGINLKVIPLLAPFTSLRTINLSANNIGRITPGALPKSLHVLDISRSKITAIEGLRELTRLRVLNLSYNKISRIGHGLANCSLIKELYLAGNKVSDIEGLHRLLKLTVLDISFNKITTVKALGQLAANYSSLLALNLLGNPIHTNIGEEQLRKSMSSLLPHLAYLNKQPIKSVCAREPVLDSVARAALGNDGRHSRNKNSKRGPYTISSRRSAGSYSRASHVNEGSSRVRGRTNKHRHDKGKSRHEVTNFNRHSVS